MADMAVKTLPPVNSLVISWQVATNSGNKSFLWVTVWSKILRWGDRKPWLGIARVRNLRKTVVKPTKLPCNYNMFCTNFTCQGKQIVWLTLGVVVCSIAHEYSCGFTITHCWPVFQDMMGDSQIAPICGSTMKGRLPCHCTWTTWHCRSLLPSPDTKCVIV